MTKSASQSDSASESHPNAKRSGRLQVSIVGGGRLGTALGRALRAEGHSIELVVSRRSSHARRAATLIGKGIPSVNSRALGEVKTSAVAHLQRSGLVLISTPDDVVEEAAGQLTRLFKANSQGKKRKAVVLHTSGALSSEVLKPLRTAGFAIGSFHPLVSVADADSDSKIFRGAFFCVEGDREAVRVARSLVKDLDGRSFTIDAKSKALYHAAAVMSSGHVTALFDLAVLMLQACGLSGPRARQVLLPLLESNTANLATKDPGRALTGPFRRGDRATVKSHLAAMKSARLSQALAAYRVLGKHSLELARQSGANREHIETITRLLNSDVVDL